ncbi:3-hydroxybutyrate dehydrogenase [Kangiella sp. TOML190]|uniref:3-hydroxybutyrate dehydrogenase n=1 Tax=Kangiella sp. TOML190 TaxID=2931351 RepID=UPI00203EDC12|nr:3-hydroxybutyrate dehydrogenase [Kangiella sp. TOML190]
MKNVLVTGGASGIGKGIAEHLAQQNYQILVTDLSKSAAQETAAEIGRKGGEAKGYALDVTQAESIAQLLADLQGRSVDILINNAGIQHVAPLEDFPMDKWQFLLDVMLVGVARLTQAILPSMKTNDFGRIINIGSIHSLVASPFKSAYVSAKHGLLGFSKVVALETAEHNITINTVCPAYVKTPLVEKQIAAQAKEHGISEQEVIEHIMLEPMPKKKFIGLDELAGTCQFLMEPAAKNITGQTITLDGGWVAR